MYWVFLVIRKLVLVVLPVVAAWYTVSPFIAPGMAKYLGIARTDAPWIVAILVLLIVGWDLYTDVTRILRVSHAERCMSVVRTVIPRFLDWYIREAAQLNPTAKLRANIMEMRFRRLRVTYHHNMDNARDLAIWFAAGEGSCGRAFAEKRPFLADYTTDEGEPYVLTRGQQELVAADRQWFWCVPVLSRDGSRVVGILNLDSDVPLVSVDDKEGRDLLTKLGVDCACELLPLLRPEEGK